MTNTPELREALRELEILEGIKSQRRRQNGIKYYVPNPTQLKAHKSIARIRLFCGGNRSGKSTLGAVELAMHLTRKYPDWYPPKNRFYNPIKAVVVATENAIIERVIEPKIKMYLPYEYIQHMKYVTGKYLSRILCKDGSTVDFLTNEQDNMAFESQDWDFYWGDEPQQKRKFDAIMRGLVDRSGRGVITFTPLVEPWMKDELVDKADSVRIEVIVADIRDNKFDINGNPILSEEAIQEFQRFISEDMWETRLHGRFFHLRGVVYPEFSEIHQARFDYNYPDPVICVLDPHDRQPHHVIWASVDPTDTLYIQKELYKACTVQELADIIRRTEKEIHSKQMNQNGVYQSIRTGFKVKRRIIDPNFGRKPLITTGRNMIQELAQAGCPGWTEANDAKQEGILKVKEYLYYDRQKPISHTNTPKLFFHKDFCRETIKSIRNYQYEEWIGKIADERSPKEKPKDKDTHGADDIRYLCMSNPTYANLTDSIYARELEEVPY